MPRGITDNGHDAISLFRELEARYWTAPRGAASKDHAVRDAYAYAHVQLYQLAQAIAGASAPQVQARLDAARREVIARLTASEDRLHMIALQPVKLRRPIRWCEVMLTPELEGNLALSGSRVPRAVAIELHEAHRAQVNAVRTAVGGAR